MLRTFIIYTFIITVAGTISLIFKKNNFSSKYFTALVIFISSILSLVYLLWNFKWIEAGAISRISSLNLLPFADMNFGIDSLSAFFLIPLLILTISSSLYGPQYFSKHPAGRMHWFFFSFLVAGMVMVLLARNAVLFIIAWEIMSLSSFFLVISENKNPESIRAGWIYFITAHVGTAFLLMLFFMLSSAAGSFDFLAWKSISISNHRADLIFIIALIAFGLKAGFIPFHVWLPELST